MAGTKLYDAAGWREGNPGSEGVARDSAINFKRNRVLPRVPAPQDYVRANATGEREPGARIDRRLTVIYFAP